MTRFTFRTTITVEVDMADEGERGDYDGEVTHWGSPEEQEESARDWARQAMPLGETYGEEWIEVEVPELKLVATTGNDPKTQRRGSHS